MNQPSFQTVVISEGGLAFGHGTISTSEADKTALAAMDSAIRSPQILVPIDRDDTGKIIDDDGCGDGREAKSIFTRTERFKRSLHRPKVFGGAVPMRVASLIGTGRAQGLPLPDVFSLAIDKLNDEGTNFGAHTDETAHGDNCGCGAIDRAPEAIEAALKYREPITAVIELLGADTSQLDVVYENWGAYMVNSLANNPQYSGSQVAAAIIDQGKVVKELAGEHRERAIVLNTVPGFTVDQSLVRDATRGEAQTFAVDVWRMKEITAKAYDTPTAQDQAYLSKLIYTLAVSAVLTNGDLPVYMTQTETRG